MLIYICYGTVKPHLHVVSLKPCSWRGVIDTTLCDKVCQLLVIGQWFSQGTLVSSTNKTDCHDITEILLKVALNTITQPLNLNHHLHEKVL